MDLERFSITSLAHQWLICSEWVLRESEQLIKNYNNPQEITKTLVISSREVWSENLHVCKKQIIITIIVPDKVTFLKRLCIYNNIQYVYWCGKHYEMCQCEIFWEATAFTLQTDWHFSFVTLSLLAVLFCQSHNPPCEPAALLHAMSVTRTVKPFLETTASLNPQATEPLYD